MARMQFLGTAPTRKSKRSQLVEAMGEGIKGYMKGMEREEEMEMKRGELKYKLANLEHSKLVEATGLMNRTIALMDKDDPRRTEMLNDPQVQALYEAAGVPIPRPIVEEKPWANTSWVDRMKAAVTPGATAMEKERGGLRPGGIISPPVTRTQQLTPRSRLLSPTVSKMGGVSPEMQAKMKQATDAGYTEAEISAYLRRSK